MDIVVEPESCDPWTHTVLGPGMTCCVLRDDPEERDSAGAAPTMDALLKALVRRDEAPGRAWVVQVSGPADEVATLVREAHHPEWQPKSATAAARGSSDAAHATFVLHAEDRSASELIGVNGGTDRVIALLGVRADRADFVAGALEQGRDVAAVAAADVLITRQPRLGQSTVARRLPSSAVPRARARVPAPAVAGAAVLELPGHSTIGPPRGRTRIGVTAPPSRRRSRRFRAVTAMAAVLGAAVVAAGTLWLTRSSPSRAPAVARSVAPAATAPPAPTATPVPPVPVFRGVPLQGPLPAGRLGGAIAVDAARGDVMLFGGVTPAGQVLSDTWTFNGTSWSQPPLRRSPPARNGAVATWDPSISEVVVFGGVSPAGTALNDTWIWSGAIWKNLLPTRARPPAGMAAGLTFDTARNELVLVTTGPASSTQPGAVDAETWTWAGTTWGRLQTAASPVLTGPATVTYDPAVGLTILVDVASNTTWSFDGTSWTQQPATGLALDPGGVTHAAYDAAMGAVVLVEDGQPAAGSSTTWTYAGLRWHRSSATATLPDIGSLTPDPSTNGVVALGGAASATDLGLRSDLTNNLWGPMPGPGSGQPTAATRPQ